MSPSSFCAWPATTFIARGSASVAAPGRCFRRTASSPPPYNGTARWSVGVVALLAGSNGEPAIVTDAIVMDLRNREGADGLIRLPQPPQLKPGDAVRITKGCAGSMPACAATSASPCS